MSLNFPNVAVLGYSHESRFFDAGFQYSCIKNLTIQGLVDDLTESFGITGVWLGEEGILTTVRNNNNYEALIINGVNFGSGKIGNISFAAGTDVRTKTYDATLIIQDSGNMFNFTGLYYSGIDISNFQYLNSFTENYEFDKKLNGGYAYSHNASIQFSSGVGNLNSIQAAQALAKTLFTGSNLGFAFYPGFTDKQGKRYITEFYDLIDNTCNFQETFDFDNDNGNYSAIYTNSVQMAEDGVITASEQGNIRGIENPNYQKALSAVNTEMAGSYLRCSGAMRYYFPTGTMLFPSPISQGRTIDIFNNQIDYSVVFNNHPNNSGFYFWDYTQQVSREDGIGTITENGSIIGRGENNTVTFQNARSGFNIVLAGIPGRVTTLFTNNFGSPTNFLESKQQSFSPVQGVVDYGYTYSNDPSLIANSGIRRKNVVINDENPVYSYNRLNIFNNKEIIQNDYQSTQGIRSISVEMEGDKTVFLPQYLFLATTEFNTNIPAGTDRYVLECNYTFNPNEGNVRANLSWGYNRFATQTIFI